jgi:hypothetical protein
MPAKPVTAEMPEGVNILGSDARGQQTAPQREINDEARPAK